MSKVAEVLRKQGLKKMSSREREAVVAELNEIKEQLKGGVDPQAGTASRPDLLQEKDKLNKRSRVLEEMLNKDDDLTPRGNDRTILDNRRKELEAIIRKEQLSEREEKLKPTSGRDFEKAVQKQLSHQRLQLANIHEWQDIMRKLDPDNPEAAHPNNLR